MVGRTSAFAPSGFIACALTALFANHCIDSHGDTAGGGGGASDASGGATSGAGGSSGRGGTTSTGGIMAGGGTAPSGGAAGSGEGGEGVGPVDPGVEAASVASVDGYIFGPAPACTTEWIDFDCDGDIPLDCDVPGEVISFTASSGSHCPYCAPPPAGEVAPECSAARSRYGVFLAEILAAGCANYCESDAECTRVPLTNACGRFVMAARGLVDEEPFEFAREYAATHCGACGTPPPASDAFFDDLRARCVERTCVLVP
ncbi:MAG TPA: hypothetical protein VFZ53_20855 [Polyangiaceae bacterium]